MNSNNTGITYDPLFIKHNKMGHPESANRLNAIIKKINIEEFKSDLENVNARPATTEELTLCHTPDYVEEVKSFTEQGGGYLDQDTYTNEFTYNAASMAAGAIIDLSTLVINGELKNGFALVRPPGHHALSNRAMGFCIFGNIAIAAKSALNNKGIKKVAIVDFDVHHGNGTQALVEKAPNILFISTHQYPFYPGSGNVNEIGTGEAEGTLLNIPLEAGVGDSGFLEIYNEIIIPKLINYKPDIILVSAGYDAHWNDPLANMGLSLSGYTRISEKLVKAAEQMCDSKIVFTLEGGYNLEVLSNGVINSIKALMGRDDFEDPIGSSSMDEPSIKGLIDNLKMIYQL
jgi:acetoin utilization deacetylase AcuC-like enzyme